MALQMNYNYQDLPITDAYISILHATGSKQVGIEVVMQVKVNAATTKIINTYPEYIPASELVFGPAVGDLYSQIYTYLKARPVTVGSLDYSTAIDV